MIKKTKPIGLRPLKINFVKFMDRIAIQNGSQMIIDVNTPPIGIRGLVNYKGNYVYGPMNFGKTMFARSFCAALPEAYGWSDIDFIHTEDLRIPLTILKMRHDPLYYEDIITDQRIFGEGTRPVQVYVIDDASQHHHSRRSMGKSRTKLVNDFYMIRHYFEKLRPERDGVVIVMFLSQVYGSIDLSFRRMMTCKILKAYSSDDDELKNIRRTCGKSEELEKALKYITELIERKHYQKAKSYSIVSTNFGARGPVNFSELYKKRLNLKRYWIGSEFVKEAIENISKKIVSFIVAKDFEKRWVVATRYYMKKHYPDWNFLYEDIKDTVEEKLLLISG
jgi:hypothetical protein